MLWYPSLMALLPGCQPEKWRQGGARMSVNGNAPGVSGDRSASSYPHTSLKSWFWSRAPHLLLKLPLSRLRNLNTFSIHNL